MASPLKISTSFLSNLLVGKQAKYLFNKGFLSAAKSGGESSSTQSMMTGIRYVLMNTSKAKIQERINRSSDKFEDLSFQYEKSKKELESITDKNSKEYIDKLNKVNDLKEKSDEAFRSALSNTISEFLGESSLKEAWKGFKSHSADIDVMFGKMNKEEYEWNKSLSKYKNILKNIEHTFSFISSSHYALKSFSGRYHFASSFMAKIESAMEKGENLLDYNKINEIAAEAATDWSSGMYQQDNKITKWANELIEKAKSNQNIFIKGIGHTLNWDIQITKVPVNQINEAITEMALGLPLSFIKYQKLKSEAKKIAKTEVPKRITKEQQ
ncbi:MAG: hypothetical protein ACR2HS_02505, partial [Gammaproteobacteria bacterium]